jgi:hypothetical protein
MRLERLNTIGHLPFQLPATGIISAQSVQDRLVSDAMCRQRMMDLNYPQRKTIYQMLRVCPPSIT